MATRAVQSAIVPVQLALSEGSTTPTASTNAVAYSTTMKALMRWTGTVWTVLVPGYATTMKYGVD